MTPHMTPHDSHATPHPIPRSLEEIITEFGPIDQGVFNPIQLEPPTPAQRLLPPTFSGTSHPFGSFALFLTLELFALLQLIQINM
jgi:hypothetical protein